MFATVLWLTSWWSFHRRSRAGGTYCIFAVSSWCSDVFLWRGTLEQGTALKCLDLLGFCDGCVVLVWYYESRGGGNRTHALAVDTAYSSHTETAQIRAKAKHIKALQNPVAPASLQKPALSEHPQDISLHPKCALCVPHPLPEDLRVVVAAWESLPAAVKAGILAMINVVRQQ